MAGRTGAAEGSDGESAWIDAALLVTLPVALALALALVARPAYAVAPWPAEPWEQAETLTHLDSDFQINLSGAHWNPDTRTLWVCTNGPGRFWALVEDGEGSFLVDARDGTPAEFSPGGDLEGITQADPREPAVYVINEAQDQIEKFDVSTYGTPGRLAKWDISAHMPTSGWAGSEGIAFVPDGWLDANGFVDAVGEPRTSRNGMGGLMFVAHQNGGDVYAFDLDPAGDAFDFVGSYATSHGESSGLEFDRSNGTLYVWHNTGSNVLELSDLSSFVRTDGRRQLTSVAVYAGPRSGNLEGFAATPASSHERWCFLTDDDNQDGAALLWFREFVPLLLGNDRYALRSGTTLTVPAPGVLANDFGPPAAAVLLSEPAHGRLDDLVPGSVFAGGFTYTPDFAFHGTDVFTYKEADGDVDSAEASVLLRVSPRRRVAARVPTTPGDARGPSRGAADVAGAHLEVGAVEGFQAIGLPFADRANPPRAAIARASSRFAAAAPGAAIAVLFRIAARPRAVWRRGSAGPTSIEMLHLGAW